MSTEGRSVMRSSYMVRVQAWKKNPRPAVLQDCEATDGGAMCFDDLADQPEPQARPMWNPGLGFPCAESSLEYSFPLLGRDAESMAADLQSTQPRTPPTADTDCGLRERVLDGIVHQIYDNLTEHFDMPPNGDVTLEARIID